MDWPFLRLSLRVYFRSASYRASWLMRKCGAGFEIMSLLRDTWGGTGVWDTSSIHFFGGWEGFFPYLDAELRGEIGECENHLRG